MSVLIGSARINEKGGINGGAAGDQTGGEVATQAWYLHGKGWVVIRAKDPNDREDIARNMQAICDNNNIGYCQDHRTALTNAAKPYGYDASKVKTKVEVDCSEAVRNCVLYAGIMVGTFNTASEVSALRNTGKFDILTDDKHCKSSDYLLRGDILVTKTKGHTVVVLSNGSKAGASSVGSSSGGSAASSTLAVGTIVNFTGKLHYTSSNAANGKGCKPGKAKITQTYNGKHPYHLEAVSGGGSTVHGWVDAADIQGISGSSGQASGTSSKEIKVGDIVKYSGTVHYTSSYAEGKSRACKGGKAKVTQISKGKPHPYHLESAEKGCTVHGWVNADKVSR